MLGAGAGLKEKVDAKATMLSGGMKRKLCLAIALLGESRFVVCDEPTSGMDPYSRRSTWNILQDCRSGRTMILTVRTQAIRQLVEIPRTFLTDCL